MNRILYVTAAIWVLLCLFWQLIEGYFQVQIYEPVNALCVTLVCYCLFKVYKVFVTFFILCASMNNLIDETFGTWDKFYIAELLLLIIIPLFWYIKTKRNVREV